MQKIMGNPYRISTLLTGFFIFFTFFPILSAYSTSLKLGDIVHGPAKIKNESGSYYYFRAKISTQKKADLIFKQYDCILTGTGNQQYKECWINLAGWAAGLSVSQQAPILMRTMQVELFKNQTSTPHTWNTSKIDGDKGLLSMGLPEKGFVEMYFLWKVPSNFSAKKIKIGDLLEVSF